MDEEVDKTLHFKGKILGMTTVSNVRFKEKHPSILVIKLKLYSLTGQMMFFAEWDVMLYLCSPILNGIGALTDAGLFINDLAMHDFSRDLLLAGSTHTD